MPWRQTTYQLGDAFPHEGFVQKAVADHFAQLGFETIEVGRVDLVCHHPQTKRIWHIEVKGRTSAIGLDFRTGLGQLLCQMDNPSTCYALAVPNIPPFINQCRKVRPWVREALGLHWLLVSEDGSVRDLGPTEEP